MSFMGIQFVQGERIVTTSSSCLLLMVCGVFFFILTAIHLEAMKENEGH